VYSDMEQWESIRRRVLVEHVSKRQILRETGMHWQTLEKILGHSTPPGYRARAAREKPKLGMYLPRIRQILEDDREVPKKQRHTAKRIFERIRDEGYDGGYTQVKLAVRQIRQRSKEVFVPLVHRPGEAQFDFGFALARIGGVLTKVAFSVMALPYSDAFFVQAFPRISTEVLWEAHVRSFGFFGGVPYRITYDNDSVIVDKVLAGRDRRLTRGFLELSSHYLFEHHFCRVRRGNEKGIAEGAVKYARLNFMVPVPRARDYEELNAHLSHACRSDLARRLRGQKATKARLLEEDRVKFLPLPGTAFDASRKVSTAVNSLSLVRFDRNDYSVPVCYAHHTVVARGYVDRVEIGYLGETIARHRRLWGKEGVRFDPVHYLALLERKPGALDHARPLENWDLPDGFHVLRRRLEDERGGEGTREYIRVLRLLEKHDEKELTSAVTKALRAGALTRDAIAQWLFPREEWRETTFRLAGREHLRRVKVETTRVSAYSELLSAGAGS